MNLPLTKRRLVATGTFVVTHPSEKVSILYNTRYSSETQTRTGLNSTAPNSSLLYWMCPERGERLETIPCASTQKMQHTKTTQQLVYSRPNTQCASHLAALMVPRPQKPRIEMAVQILQFIHVVFDDQDFARVMASLWLWPWQGAPHGGRVFVGS